MTATEPDINESSKQPVLELRDATFAYAMPSGRVVRAVSEVSIALHENEVVSIIGPSGCGKSTLLRIFAGLLTPSQGTRLVADCIDNNRLAISLNFQSPTLLPWLSVAQNAMLPFELAGVGADQSIKALLDRLLALVGLSACKDAVPSELSGGMAMRAAFVRSFVTQPAIVLMDEPFSALDEVTRQALSLEFRRLCKHHRTAAIFVTHNIREAIYVADRIIILSKSPGRVIGDLRVANRSQKSDEMTAINTEDIYLNIIESVHHEW
jgi:NitT/TauT family transport system ATP-binding protein